MYPRLKVVSENGGGKAGGGYYSFADLSCYSVSKFLYTSLTTNSEHRRETFFFF